MPDRRLLAAENEDLKRRLVEQARALSEAEARYEAVFNSSLTFMSLCTAEGVVLDVSGPSLELGGVPIEDCVGKLVWETPLYTANPEEGLRLKEAVARADRGMVRYETHVLASDTNWHVFEVVIRPVRAQLGDDPRF